MLKDNTYLGSGEFNKLERLVEKYNPTKIFLVTGDKSYVKTGIKSRIEKILSSKEYFRHYNFSSNPKLKDIVKGVQKFHLFNTDLIIGVGGGSVMDTAKLLSVLPPEAEVIKEIITGKRKTPSRKVPFIVIPTTAGSGSEATHFAVAYVEGTKYSVASEFLYPDWCILDPDLTRTLPHRQKMISAFDAFSQAVESYWAAGGTSSSREYAAESIKLILKIYPELLKKPSGEIRAAMMKASHLSGRAINISKTTCAHALSYTLTSRYGIAHGYAVILILSFLFKKHIEASENRIVEGLDYSSHKKRMSELCKLMGTSSGQSSADKIKSMVRKAGFDTKLRNLGVNKENLNMVADKVNPERLKNNPVLFTKKELRSIIYSIW